MDEFDFELELEIEDNNTFELELSDNNLLDLEVQDAIEIVPYSYLKDAETSGDKLTITKSDDTQVIYNPDIPKKYLESAVVEDDTLTFFGIGT